MKLRLATFAIALAVLCDGQSRVYGAAADKFQETAAFLAASLSRFLDDNVSLSATTRLTISNPSGDAPPAQPNTPPAPTPAPQSKPQPSLPADEQPRRMPSHLDEKTRQLAEFFNGEVVEIDGPLDEIEGADAA